jgi:Gram-negative porin
MPTLRPRFVTLLLLPGVLAVQMWSSRTASAEIVFGKVDNWEISTDGRVNGFFSHISGDAYPADTPVNHSLLAGAGLESRQIDNAGNLTTTRFRTGFVGAVLGFSVKLQMTEDTTLRAHVATWNTIETSRNKAAPNPTDVREAYGKVEGPWGGLLFGRALALFSRGAISLDFNYQHGNGLGYPCNADGGGPTCGMVGYGVVFAGFNPQLTYNTPDLGGFQLSVGLFDPSNAPGKLERTPLPRLESEVIFEKKFRKGLIHVFVNGFYQYLAQAGDPKMPTATPNLKSTSARAINYGGWAELAALRVGYSSHIGYGIGMNNTLENTPVVFDSNNDPRKFDAYYGVVGLVMGRVYLNGGYGISRLFATTQDLMEAAAAAAAGSAIPDPIKSQRGIALGLNYSFSKNLIAALEYFNAVNKWYVGDSQTINAYNAGLTMVW